MKYLVAYDIKDDKRRVKVFKLLKGYGFNIQKSIFEVFILNKKMLKDLEIEIKSLINPDEDLVYIFPYYKDPITNENYKDFFKRDTSET